MTIGYVSWSGNSLFKNKSLGIDWTMFEVSSWNNMSGQKVSNVILGLREDGVVVWREDAIVSRTYPCAMFPNDSENIKVGTQKYENTSR